MALPWVVHTYYINISKGDCAIHLLCEPRNDNRFTVQRAVLIDGGKPKNNIWPRIWVVAQKISEDPSYVFPAFPAAAPLPLASNTRLRLQFDAIIITHWDDDHWGGVLASIRHDLARQADEKLSNMSEVDRDNAIAAGRSNNRDLIVGLRPSFFKYSTPQTPKFLTEFSDPEAATWTAKPEECLTTVYLPCEPIKTYARLNPKEFLSYNSTSFATAYPKLSYAPGQVNTLDIKFRPENSMILEYDGWNTYKTLCVAKVMASYRDFLGVEVFHSTTLGFANQWQTVTTPQMLIETHCQLRKSLNAAGSLANLPQESSPMMFMVGGGLADDLTNRSIVIGNIPPPTPTARKLHINVVDGFTGQTDRVATSGVWKSNETNSMSLMCVLMCPVFSDTRKAGTFETKDFALRHFFAGDALWPTETALAKWLSRKKAGDAFTEGNTAQCPLMKLSHHGDCEASSLAILNTIQPEKVIVSNSDDQTWGHPHFELVFTLHAMWSQLYERDSERGDWLESRLYTTYFPAYFDGDWKVSFESDDSYKGVSGFTNKPGFAHVSLTHAAENTNDDGEVEATDLDTDAAPGAENKDLAWIDDLAQRYKNLNWKSDRRNIFARMKKETDTHGSMRARCIRWMFEIWSDISNVKPTYSVVEKVGLNSTGTFSRQRNALSYYKCEIASTGSVSIVAHNEAATPLIDVDSFLFSVEQANFQKRDIGVMLRMAKPSALMASMGSHLPMGTIRPMAISSAPQVPMPKSRKRPRDEIVQLSGGIDRREVSEAAGLFGSPPDANDDLVQPNKSAKTMTALPLDFDIESDEIPEANVDRDAFWYDGYPDYTGAEFDAYWKAHGTLPPPKPIKTSATASEYWPFEPMQITPLHTNLVRRAEAHVVAAIRTLGTSDAPPTMKASTLISTIYDKDISDPSEALLAGLMNDFVACLNIGALALQAVPVWSVDVAAFVADLNPLDEWMSSLLGNSLGIVAGSLRLDTPVAGDYPTRAVAITVQNPGKSFSENSKGEDPTWNLIFDTASNSQQFGTSDWLLQPQNILVAGLSPSSGFKEVMFSDFAIAFGLPGGQLLGIAEDFAAMSDPDMFKLTLDQPKPGPSTTVLRNGLFLQADSSLTSTLRLQFRAEGLKVKLNSLLSPFKMQISDIKVIGKKVSKVRRAGANIEARVRSTVAISATATLGNATATVWLVFGTGTIKVIIRPASASLDALLQWCESLFDSKIAGVGDAKPQSVLGNDACADLRLLEVELTLVKDLATGKMRMDSLDIDFSFDFKTPRPPGKSAAFYLSFSYPQMRFCGTLWPAAVTATAVTRQWLSPDYEDYSSPPMPSFKETILITDFLPKDTPDLPQGLPIAITRLTVEIVRNARRKSAAFGCTLRCPPVNPEKGEVPRVALDQVTLDIQYIKAGTGSSTYEVSFSATVILNPRSTASQDVFVPLDQRSKISPAALTIDINLSSGGWILTGHVVNLQFATLYSLMDSDYNEGVMDIMEHFSIKDLLVTYQHSKTGLASNLNLSAKLGLGPFELDLLYVSTSADPSDLKNNPAKWSITAWLGQDTVSASDPYTVGDLIHDIVGPNSDMSDVQNASFIADIPVPFLNSGSSIEDSLIAFEVAAAGKGLLMWFRLRLTASLHITVIQLQAEGVTGKPRPQPKRVILVSADTLPTLQTIPVVNKLPQPFDQLDYVWVQDNNGTGMDAGLTRLEVDQINAALAPTGQVLPFKDVSKKADASADATTTPMVILTGHHFMISRQSQVVLDYVFGRKTVAPENNNQPQPPRRTLAINNTNRRFAGGSQDSVMNSPDAGASKASAKFSLGPVAVSNIGLQYKAGKLWVLVDATVSLGPIELTLIGFGIGLDLSKIKLHELNQLILAPQDIMIHGISVDFNKPPVLAAGVFIHEDNDQVEIFQGGIALAIQPYMLLAVGAYKHYKKPDFKSVFIYARLDGPLVELEFGEISGVRAGFGYNNSLSVPRIADVDKFPLVFDSDAMNANSGANDPMKVLQAFGPYQHDQEGTFWVAAGMKVTAFQTVSITAVILVSFDPLPMLAIVGQAVASMPPKVPDPKFSFLYVKLGVLATLDIPHGSLRVEAQLANDSFVLNPFVHLSGGAALCYWFKGSGHEGDWVFTVGGYHRQFRAPDHYPKPPRVKISWSFDDMVSITGEAYFAITPRVAMGGGRLKILFSANPLYADLEAWADFLIQFKPFYMMADIGVSVGVEFTLDLWLVTIHISVHLGAQVHLEGPEFGGWVYVDFYLFGFTVHFGAPTHAAMAIELDEFLSMIKEPGPGHARTISDKSSPTGTHDFTLTLEAGEIAELSDSMHNAADDADYTWPVRAGQLRFRVETKFPVRTMSIQDKAEPQNKAKVEGSAPIYSRPMWVESPITTSDLTIDVDNDSENGWQITPITKPMPAAVWGPYSDAVDPRKPGDKTKSLLPSSDSDKAASPATIDLWAGVTIKAPKPKLSEDIVPAINAQALMHASVYKTVADNPVLIDKAETQNTAFQPSDPASSDSTTDIWEQVRTQWARSDREDDRTALSQLASWALQWDDSVQTMFGRLTTSTPASDDREVYRPLNVKVPDSIVKDAASFETYFMEVPVMT